VWGLAETGNMPVELGKNFRVLRTWIHNALGIKVCVLQQVDSTEKKLFVYPPRSEFEGVPFCGGLLCSLNWQNIKSLVQTFPELKPTTIPPSWPSFGFGDRLGLATPGHIQALYGAKVFPVLAQQSMRENARTGRTFADVLSDALVGVLQTGWSKGYGADADHLKDIEEARNAARLGYSFFTCDPSDLLVPVERLAAQDVLRASRELPVSTLRSEYLGRSFSVPELGNINFTKDELLRIAVKYWQALKFAEEMYQALQEELPQGFDFELSMDETLEPTTVKEHLFLALELRRREIRLTSLAPRFPGVMEKAVDYQGDPQAFRQALRAHVAIAQKFGPYRISLHSGSDKWKLYPVLARETQGLWHVKTAGTSYLVALQVIAHVSPTLFREILRCACEHFSKDRQGYHISTELREAPDSSDFPDSALPELFKSASVRQILHVTFGSVLKVYGEDIKRTLLAHEEEYYQALAHHLGRHLEALGVKDDGKL